MANQKISALPAITGANMADNDKFVLVDTSADATKAITREEFFRVTPSIDVNGAVTTNGLTVNTNDQAIINHSANGGGLRIDSTNATNTGSIRFGDTTDNYIGALEYKHTDDAMTMYVNNAERLRIDNSGHTIIPAGVTLGTATGVYNADNTLNDYEVGTWTPSVGTGTTVYSVQQGYYTKIGRAVTVIFNLGISTIGDGSSGTISGLPFAPIFGAVPPSGVISTLTNSAVACVSAAGQIGTADGGNIRIAGKTSSSINTAILSPFQNSTAIYMTAVYYAL